MNPTIEFPRFPSPRVSILILAWRQHALLQTCLQHLSESISPSIAYEVIVVLNGATPEVDTFLRRHVQGATLLTSRVNRGFAGANNWAANTARGEYLVLLNDDTTVGPRWLEWLVATADNHPRAGAVGSCILFPDGRLQEAGSIIWNDGSTMPVARNESGGALDWHFVRKVDYVSACSLLVRRTSWDAVGGLDEGYFPAYYEDVDLCLSIHARGEDVLYEPRSRVRHHESASSDPRFKLFLSNRNKKRLIEKWPDALSVCEPAAPWSPPAITRAIWRARGCPRRILVIDDVVPSRGLGAGFGRMFDALIEMADLGHAVSIAPSVRANIPNDALISKGIRVVTEPLNEHLARPDVCYEGVIVSRPHNFRDVAELFRRHQTNAVVIYDAEALYWRRLERQAELAADAVEAERLRHHAELSQELEQRIFREAHYAVAVSSDEAEIVRAIDGACPIDVLAPIEPGVSLTGRSFETRQDLGFVAGWLAGSSSPNADGLRWFVNEVLPCLRTRVPWIRLRVVGANPPADILALSNPNLGFEGYVDNLSEFYDRVRVGVVPIRFGSGVKLKTVEALQYGLPIVSTTVGAEGIDTRGIAAIEITDDPHEFADRIIALLADAQKWHAQRASIEELVRSWQTPLKTTTWTSALDRAFSERRRGEQSIFVQH